MVPSPCSSSTTSPCERAQRRELQAFAGTVAHDLRTPLTGVGSWAEILGDQLDSLDVDVTQPRASLRRIETSADRMDQLIHDLLIYSQAQSATLAPESLSLDGDGRSGRTRLPRDRHRHAPASSSTGPWAACSRTGRWSASS